MKNRNYFFNKGEEYLNKQFEINNSDDSYSDLTKAIKCYSKFIYFNKKFISLNIDDEYIVNNLSNEINYTKEKIEYIKKYIHGHIKDLKSLYSEKNSKIEISDINGELEDIELLTAIKKEEDGLDDYPYFDNLHEDVDKLISSVKEVKNDLLKVNPIGDMSNYIEKKSTDNKSITDNSEDLNEEVDISELITIFSLKKILNRESLNKIVDYIKDEKFNISSMDKLFINSKKLLKLEVIQTYKIIMELREYNRVHGKKITKDRLIRLILSVKPHNLYKKDKEIFIKKNSENSSLEYNDNTKFDISNPYYYFYKGNNEYIKGNYNQAIKNYILSLQIHINIAEVYFNIGMAYIALEKNGLAVENLRNAILLDSHYGYEYYKKNLNNSKIFMSIKKDNIS